MPTPKKKTTRSRRGMRRSHDALTPPNPGQCPNCGALVRAHHACNSCGQYKEREVLPGKA